MIIDSHLHITPFGYPQEHNGLEFSWSDLETWLKSEKNLSAQVMTTLTQNQDSVKINDIFFDQINQLEYKHKLYPFYWTHSNELSDSIFKKHFFYGVKFHPSISQSTLDKNLDILDLCSKYDKPILIHCGRNEKSNIKYILNVNEQYDDVNFIVAHMGGLATDLIMSTLSVIKNRYADNIWFDTSGCHLPKIITKSIQICGADKILFGTDRPFHDYNISKYVIDMCNISQDVKNMILHQNYQKLLNI